MDHEGINLLLAQVKQAHFASSKLCDMDFAKTAEMKSLTLNSLKFSLAEIGAGIASIPAELTGKFPKVKWEFFELMHRHAALDSDFSKSVEYSNLIKWIGGELAPALESLRKYLLSALLD
jgi:uncharacterized protein with HEPN domain